MPGIELIEDALPDESAILRFRHLLERHQLTQKLFELVRGLLKQTAPLGKRSPGLLGKKSPVE